MSPKRATGRDVPKCPQMSPNPVWGHLGTKMKIVENLTRNFCPQAPGLSIIIRLEHLLTPFRPENLKMSPKSILSPNVPKSGVLETFGDTFGGHLGTSQTLARFGDICGHRRLENVKEGHVSFPTHPGSPDNSSATQSSVQKSPYERICDFCLDLHWIPCESLPTYLWW